MLICLNIKEEVCMSLLIVGNGHLTKVGSKLFKDKHSGAFLKEVTESAPVIWHEPINDVDTMCSDLHVSEVPQQNFNVLFNKAFPASSKLKKLYYYFLFAFTFVKRRTEINNVYIFFPGSVGILMALLSMILRKPYGIYLRANFSPKNWIHTYIFKKAKYMLVTGNYFKKQLEPINENVEVVSTMMDLNKKDVKLKKLSEAKSKNILFVGRVHSAKGIWSLLSLMERLDKENQLFHLDVVGGGDELEAFKRKVLEKGLDQRIKVHGLISQKEKLKNLYNSADVFILPSIAEGVPRVLYEALSYSVPVLTTFVGSIPSIMVDGFNCFELKGNSSEEIYNKLMLLFSSKKIQRDFMHNGVETMESYFSNKSDLTHAQQLKMLIERACNE